MKIADLPQDLDPHRFFVQWYGLDALSIERHKGILRFGSSEIRFLTEQGVLTINGEDLTLQKLTESEANVFGRILCLSVEAKS